jgi:hypothetical protein
MFVKEKLKEEMRKLRELKKSLLILKQKEVE